MADPYTALATYLSEKTGEVVTRDKAKRMFLAGCYSMDAELLEKMFLENVPEEDAETRV